MPTTPAEERNATDAMHRTIRQPVHTSAVVEAAIAGKLTKLRMQDDQAAATIEVDVTRTPWHETQRLHQHWLFARAWQIEQPRRMTTIRVAHHFSRQLGRGRHENTTGGGMLSHMLRSM